MGKEEPFLRIFSDAGVERHGVAGEQPISMFLGLTLVNLGPIYLYSRRRLSSSL